MGNLYSEDDLGGQTFESAPATKTSQLLLVLSALLFCSPSVNPRLLSPPGSTF